MYLINLLWTTSPSPYFSFSLFLWKILFQMFLSKASHPDGLSPSFFSPFFIFQESMDSPTERQKDAL